MLSHAIGILKSRFYSEQRFPKHLCDQLYEVWLEKSCSGYTNAVLVAYEQDHIAGYVTCNLQPEHQGQIGLVGVAAEDLGKGIGMSRIKVATNWFAENNIHTITVVTQGINIAAQRLYQRSGFIISSTEFWSHLWLGEPSM